MKTCAPYRRVREQALLADLKTGVFTFVTAAERCDFFDDILVTSFR